MKIGIAKEIKDQENRVAITPDQVAKLVEQGHEVLVQAQAGSGAGFEDQEYGQAGAELVSDPVQVWQADLVLKVKEPLASEYQYLRPGLILMTYLHLAANRELVEVLQEKGVTAIAYETVELDGKLPLLQPMSEVAGAYAVQVGSQLLEKHHGGKGILLGEIPGVEPGRVVIIGGGVVGMNAAKMALGLGAQVTILDNNPGQLEKLDKLFDGQAQTVMSNEENIAKAVLEADLVIGSVLVAGRRAPVLVSEDMVKSMEDGSVLVDIAIDQGGNFATSDRATTHEHPVYVKHGVTHYAVANMPGAVPRTATQALTNATIPYVEEIAKAGLEEAARNNPAIASGINLYQGTITSQAVAESLDMDFQAVEDLLK